MAAYEFYFNDRIDGPHLIGILPERRSSKERITRESIMNWVKKFLGEKTETLNIYYVEVNVNRMTGEILESRANEG